MVPLVLLVALCTISASTQAAAPTKKRILDGERLPFSPKHFLDGDHHHHHHSRGTANRNDHHRELESNEEEFASFLVDRNGNEYEPYSLAWRYLGMYMDCNVDYYSYYESEYVGRFLGENGNGDCERVLLWAAYVDPRYRGGSIGEYQFYNVTTGEWDGSTCRTKRCARMDCHEPDTHFKLVGVFKETDGLDDWAEQLFKHEGYCVWDSSIYSFMQRQRQNWPTSCFQATYSDSYGNALYMDLLPQGEGNVTIGMFTDESCTQVSTTTTFLDYVVIYYKNAYGSEDAGMNAALSWNYTFEKWNEYMDSYKICQPCRSYNLNKFRQEDEEGRYLENNKNDGEGEEEQWGYNCYDDAGRSFSMTFFFKRPRICCRSKQNSARTHLLTFFFHPSGYTNCNQVRYALTS